MTDRAKNALELRLDAGASPERVALAARLLARMLKAAAPNLPEDAVTMVVQNYALRATIRTRTVEAERVVRRVLRLLENPTRAAAKEPHASDLAAAIVEDGRELEQYVPRFYRPRKKQPIAEVNAGFMKTMRFIAEDLRHEQVVRGSTILYSRVYRVGTTDEGRDAKARILASDKPVDVTINEAVVDRFFDAAKSQRVLPIRIEGCWVRTGEGLFVLDARRSTATDVDTEWQATSGRELVEKASEVIGDAFDDIDDVLARIEGR